MKRGIIFALFGIMFFGLFVGYKYWKYPKYDTSQLAFYNGNLIHIEWVYHYFRSAPKYYMLLETEDGSRFYIHPVLLGKTKQILLEQSINGPITIQYDQSANKETFGAFRVLAISDDSNEFLSLEDANRAFGEQRWIGIILGSVVLILTELVAFWLISDSMQRKKHKRKKQRTH